MNKPLSVQVTKEGFEDLKVEQANLIAKRPDVLKRMVAAREQGDLSENAGYHATKGELAHIDHRLRELKLLINNAQVVEVTSSDVVGLGCTVTVEHDGAQSTYSIVGPLEADPIESKMSNGSPIGKALIGRKVGDVVDVVVPSGTVQYKVIKIESTN